MSKKEIQIKLEHNWRFKTIELLEKDVWQTLSGEETTLIKRCHALRKKMLNDFTVEDLRIMIGQNIGLDYLVPLAIEVLNEDLFAEGDYYEGDLLKNVLNIAPCFWANNKTYWEIINSLLTGRLEELSDMKINYKCFYEKS